MTEPENNAGKENSSMALSGMILGIIGLICSFTPSWRTIGIVIAFVGLAVSVFALIRLNKGSEKKVRATLGIIISIVGIAAGAWFLATDKPKQREEVEPVPAELQQSQEKETDHENALEKLQGLTDSSATPQ